MTRLYGAFQWGITHLANEMIHERIRNIRQKLVCFLFEIGAIRSQTQSRFIGTANRTQKCILACKVMRVFRDIFYRYQELVE